MIPISTRFFVPLLAVLFLTAIPVTMHHIVGYRVDDCADPEALRRLSIAGTTIDFEDLDRYSSSVIQFSEGTNTAQFPFRVIRSFEIQRFYDDWPRGLMLGKGFYFSPKTEWVKAGGVQLPIVIWSNRHHDRVHVAAKLLIYRSQPVEDLFESGAAHAMSQLLGGVPAVTMIGANGVVPADQLDEAEEALKDWFVEVWNYYAKVCGAG